jgi:hypothetical protein
MPLGRTTDRTTDGGTAVKLRELLRKIRRRSARERSSDSVNRAFIASSEEAPSRGFPSQQDDGPRH